MFDCVFLLFTCFFETTYIYQLKWVCLSWWCVRINLTGRCKAVFCMAIPLPYNALVPFYVQMFITNDNFEEQDIFIKEDLNVVSLICNRTRTNVQFIGRSNFRWLGFADGRPSLSPAIWVLPVREERAPALHLTARPNPHLGLSVRHQQNREKSKYCSGQYHSLGSFGLC